ncbi:MAG: hypothetical protein AAB583_03350 [Patescibacteria group bacterium]
MKNDIMIYFDIITSVRTAEDLDQLASEIDSLLVSVFKTQEKSFDNALEEISISTSKKIKEAFKKNALDIENKEIARNFLERLKDLFGKFKTIGLTLAIEPSHEMTEHIHNWVSEILGEGYILKIETDKSLLGGATVVSPSGQYRDFTVKKSLEKVFSERKEIVQLS